MISTRAAAAAGARRAVSLKALRFARSNLGLLLLLTLAGCARFSAAPAPQALPVSGDAHAAKIASLTRWRLHGRLGMQRGDEGFSGNIDWLQGPGAYELRIAAPLNGGTVVLAGDESQVSLINPRGERYSAPTAQALMSTHLGWEIPVAGAAYWVLGVPAPGSEATQQRLDAHGRWLDFAQAGWRISVLDYFPQGDPALPRKLFLSRDELSVRLVIKRWERL